MNTFQCHMLGADETRRILNERLDSREWWIIPQLSSTAAGAARKVMTECYPTGVGFEGFILGITGAPVVFTAHKSQMSERRIMHIMGIDDEPQDRDILIIIPDDPIARMATMMGSDILADWLEDGE